jgi:glycosyltransferase involved in cell wall biosynthesis
VFYFSVIIPTYNDRENILNAIKSVLNQSYKAFELIIIDDGSNDGTTQIISESFADSRLKVLRLESNKGPGAARNVGIRTAQGQYISFLDSDDIWHVDYLETMHEIIEGNQEYGFYFCSGRITRNGIFLGYLDNCSWVNKINSKEFFRKLYLGNFICTLGVIVRRNVLIEAGLFDETMLSAQDHDLWLRIAYMNVKFYYIDKSLFDIRMREGSITTNFQRRINNQKRMLIRHNNKFSEFGFTWIKSKQVLIHGLSNIYIAASWDCINRDLGKQPAIKYAIKGVLFFPRPWSVKNLIAALRYVFS